MKTFLLETKLGSIHFRVNGAGEILVDTTRPSRGYPDKEERIPVTIRGVAHTGNVRFGFLPNGEIDGRTYDYDGNTVIFVSKHDTEYMMARACWLNRAGFGGNEATHAAKIKFYTEIKTALNTYYRHHKAEIDAERFERAKECHAGQVEALEEKIKNLETELGEARRKLQTMIDNPPTGV